MKAFSLAVSVLWLVLSMLCPAPAGAMVTGTCQFCHSGDVSNCIGCHAQNASGTQNILPVPNGGGIPQVLHHMSGGDLAGGNFYYVADGYNPDYSKGHNVAGISTKQSPPMDAPPGFKGSVIITGGVGPVTWTTTKQLTCSGTWGCHGDRTIEDPYQSIYGAHHTDDSVIDGASVGTSYRFLYGVKGKEHKTWEYQATVDNHNGYQGDRNYSSMNTISYLCGECHAAYHLHPNLGGSTQVGFGTPWLRHPADIALGNVAGYSSSEFSGYMNYDLDTPVAFTNPTGTETVVDGNSIVMCLSCHRAHASPYKSMLRWDYSAISAGTGPQKGCITCHTQKGG